VAGGVKFPLPNDPITRPSLSSPPPENQFGSGFIALSPLRTPESR